MINLEIPNTTGGTPMRDSGIGRLGAIPLGTHLGQFYATTADLLETQSPYFAAGLAANEYCLWITSPFLSAAEAFTSLKNLVPNLDEPSMNGRLEIRDGESAGTPLLGVRNALDNALSRGFNSVRVSTDAFWFHRNGQVALTRYEQELEQITNLPMLALCTYPADKGSTQEALAVLARHPFVLVKQNGEWRAVSQRGAGADLHCGVRGLFESANVGIALQKVVIGKHGEPHDFRFLDVNNGFEHLTSRRRSAVLGRRMFEVFPDLDRHWLEVLGKVALTGEPLRMDGYINSLGRWYDVFAYQTMPGSVAVLFSDVTERKQGETTLQWRVVRNQLLADAASLLLQSTDAQRAVYDLCRTVMEFMNCEMFLHYLVDENEKRLRLNAHAGIPEAVTRDLEWLDFGQLVSGRVARDGRRVVVANVQNSRDRELWLARSLGVRPYCCFPLIGQGHVIGTLAFGAQFPREFTSCEVEAMEIIAGLVAMAITRTRTEEALRNSEQRLRAIMAALPIGFAVVDANGRYITSNTAFDRIWGAGSHGDQLGRLIPCLAWRIDTGEPIAPENWPLVRAIQRGETTAGQEIRLQTFDGRLISVNCSAAPFHGIEGKVNGAVLGVIDVGKQIDMMEALRRSQQDLKQAQAVGSIGNWRVDLEKDEIIWSEETYRIFGLAPDERVSYQLFFDRVHPDDRALVEQRWQLATKGEDYDVEHRIIVGSEEKWVRARAVLEFDRRGRLTAVFGVTQDITEQKRREEQIKLLLCEVNHRAKNMLTLVQAIAVQMAASDPQDFVARFTNRVIALAASQDLLVASEWRGVNMEVLVRSQLAHFADFVGSRITIDGPSLSLAPAASQSFGMAIHELATNAGKYGALSNSDGRVGIAWRLDGERFVFTWAESGGPPVEPPTRRGFGHTVLVAMPELELDANIQLNYARDGVSWRLICPTVKALDHTSV